jgi:hypothetical protein
MKEAWGMTADPDTPKFLSLEFHTSFFPRLLWGRLRRKKKETQGTTFTSTMEMIIALAVCLILAVIGIPSALTRGSVVGWILSIIGVGGILALLIASVGAQWGNRPTYDNFLTGVFFFFVSLGILIGIPVGMGNSSPVLGVSVSLAGLLGGYMLGIFAGLRMQHLGWMALILNMVAGLAAIAMGGATLITLVSFTFK